MGSFHIMDPSSTNLVLTLSLLLAAGFTLARLMKMLQLPSVTGYIIAGIALGPSGFGIISADVLEERLFVFTNMALMLVAFSIGERFDLQQLRPVAKTLIRVSIFEIVSVLLLVGTGVSVAAYFLADLSLTHAIATAIICAAIAVETAAPTSIAVIREAHATGPLSRLILSDLVVNNAMAVTLFGLMVAIAHTLLGTGGESLLIQITAPELLTLEALGLGVVTGLICDFIVHRLHRRADVLIVSLAAVFFCGGLATHLGLSPLLAGVAAGFAIVNRDRRDVRAFRALNDFEPPLYGIFFTLAGAQLHLKELLAAGLLGLIFVVLRATGKFVGSSLGARSAGVEPRKATLLGLGLMPQAGLAIGLAYLVRQDPALADIRTLVINLVLASVVINELLGAPLTRLILMKAGETSEGREDPSPEPGEAIGSFSGIDVVPWTWPKLQPHGRTGGSVIVGLSHPESAAALTRIGVILAHNYEADPMAVHVATADTPEDFWQSTVDREAVALFRLADAEARNLGYPLDTEVEFADEEAHGLLRIAEDADAQAIVVGHPVSRRVARFGRMVDHLANEAICPVVVVRLIGALHTERILVPISCPEDYLTVRPIVRALGAIEEHEITFLRLMPAECRPHELQEAEEEVARWPDCDEIPGACSCSAVAAESRVHVILDAVEDHDVIVMASSGRRGLQRAFFGSLAEDVALQTPKPMLMVSGGMESRSLEEATAAMRDV
ncbi:MAG: hypothetical protein GF393_09365 [Armatimonadia bacterium]|nr:hypothetical protein [Armatimonadia bacterium]